MKQEETMSGQEGMQIIQKMIGQAKQQYSDESFNYLLWGWLVFVASLGHYTLAMAGFSQPYLMWMLMPLGGVISAIYNYREKKKETVKTYIDEFIKYVLIAFLVCLGIVLFSMQKLGLNCYPMVMMIYGMWLFVSGGCLRFRPFIIGGIANWILAVISLYTDFGTQLLLLALAVLVGYIIPGHMLRSRYNKMKQ
ncbi:MAG: hypothetical protein ABI772_03255 [Bacteroidota bacterium]